MSLFRVFDIASSALNAQTVRMNLTASNMANADSASSSIDQTYRARQPVFRAMLDELIGNGAQSGGVHLAGVVESTAPLRQEYQPGHPLANAEGYVYLPNVNTVEEMANMISASRSYQTNLEVINAAKQMLLRTLTLGQ